MLRHCRRAVLVAAALVTAADVQAETVTVAVASNFSGTLAALAPDFEQRTGHALRIVPGSTGRLYAQIVNGARFDVFLAADAERPLKLEADGRVVGNGRFRYAVGVLVLWSADPELDGTDCLDALSSPGKRRIAIANPRLAPYGRAAREFLEKQGLWESVKDSLVTGENVAQVAQFVASRNASLGLIAKSQTRATPLGEPSCSWEVPAGAHAPIEQQAVWLALAANNAAAADFVAYLKSARVRQKLVEFGYRPVADPP